MTDGKWSELIDSIEEKFGILEHKTQKVPFEDDFGIKGEEIIETIIFEGALGKMKIEKEVRPVILDKKVHYAKTKGIGGQIEYILSETKKTSKVKAFKWNQDQNDWEEIDVSGFSF